MREVTKMEKRTLEQIDKEIAETKAALNDVHGTETEVYARIVGYYRAVKHWNKGKRDEFDQRKMFVLQDSNCADDPAGKSGTIAQKNDEAVAQTLIDAKNLTYELYTKKTCPNCPPVKSFMESLDIDGRTIDVGTDEGLAEAAKKGIFASPTVIFYNADGTEAARCHNVEELEVVLQKEKVSA